MHATTGTNTDVAKDCYGTYFYCLSYISISTVTSHSISGKSYYWKCGRADTYAYGVTSQLNLC